ncbi:MAG: hypothetical protein V4801_33705 [Burkholderia gladioli]
MQESMQRPPIDEVVFIDDIFRLKESGLPASPENRKFLRAFFGAAAERLGWRVREVCAESQGGTLPISRILATLGQPENSEGWAALCCADLQPAEEHLASFALTPSSLVIGWGLTPAVMQLVDRAGAAFIDVEIHSVRFTRELHLGVRTNDPGIRRELDRLRIDDETFWAAAAGVRAFFARRGQLDLVREDLRVGLFVGQTAVDLALVADGRMWQPIDFVEQLRDWARDVDLLVFSAHPAQPNLEALYPVLDRIPNAVLATGNTYSLLCAGNLDFVTSLSSGTLKEARYFGHEDIRPLLADDRSATDLLPQGCSPWIPVRPDVASAHSLAAFSRSRGNSSTDHPESSAGEASPRAFADDTINQIFGYRWGLDLSAPGLPEMPRLSFGTPMRFAHGASGATGAIFGRGWHQQEDWGMWSAEARAWLIVMINDAVPEESSATFELALRGVLVTSAAGQQAVVNARVNGHRCKTRSHAEGGVEWIVSLDAGALQNRLLVISLDIQGAMRPCDVGGSAGDTRSLGIGVTALSLCERTTTPSGESAEEKKDFEAVVRQ